MARKIIHLFGKSGGKCACVGSKRCYGKKAFGDIIMDSSGSWSRLRLG